jgi:hypothetical protein
MEGSFLPLKSSLLRENATWIHGALVRITVHVSTECSGLSVLLCFTLLTLPSQGGHFLGWLRDAWYGPCLGSHTGAPSRLDLSKSGARQQQRHYCQATKNIIAASMAALPPHFELGIFGHSLKIFSIHKRTFSYFFQEKEIWRSQSLVNGSNSLG